ncbi:MAG TPA: DUF2027 domain-containing protein [Paludibacteraceae bacterium]|nr:DUF2027 domain-containing protein [Paludibacteraceae bacterium]HOU69517.1 DUF2027 domain-containing protein [Paludibacteraceae bacterium]HPH63662.1 DUF2027 domain-containing protein [Paludibacteraceae bacterium]HQF51205.1 DUF2027 domain-containing protein [Paludibacteraceae bacterium]
MAIKVGDRVRFLNSIGGGTITKIINKELVEVEDEDGFGIPTLIRECVVVETENTIHNQEKPKQEAKQKKIEQIIIEPQKESYKPEEETKEGEKINVLLAYVPIDIKALSSTSYECYLVNDSNYYLAYNIASGNGRVAFSRAAGFIQPNTKIFVEELKKEQLNDLEELNIQLMALKQAKTYTIKPTYDVELKINATKFYKLHSFTENDFFDENALLFQLVKDDIAKGDEEINENELAKVINMKETKLAARISKKSNNVPDIIEVDLHINQLIDNLNGLSNADMINYQLDKFNEIMKENEKRKGQKIVFIHGKGDGVLRNEIVKQLKSKYPNYYFQDASFREYGFGATMVTIK